MINNESIITIKERNWEKNKKEIQTVPGKGEDIVSHSCNVLDIQRGFGKVVSLWVSGIALKERKKIERKRKKLHEKDQE